jgi:hypothetical protein
MFKIELNYYAGKKKTPLLDFHEDAIKTLWAKYLQEEVKKKGKANINVEDIPEVACLAFDRFISMIKRTTISK